MVKYCVEHSAISVTDLEKSIEFYKKSFGFELVSRAKKPALKVNVALMELGDYMLEMFQPYEPRPMPESESDIGSSLQAIGTKHLCLAVDDIAMAYEALRQNRVEFETDITQGTTSSFFFCKDPDGILIEIIQRNQGRRS